MRSVRFFVCCSLVLSVLIAAPASAWHAPIHRMVTRLALAGLPDDVPDWLRNSKTAEKIAFQSNQVDRWRGWDALALAHVNDPDHYLDADLLDQFGLTLETLPPLRRECLRALAIAKHEHPEQIAPYDPAKDPARKYEWPGFVLHRISEEYACTAAALHQVRILEQLADPNRAIQLEQARAIAIVHIGNLAHFVADVAQPLHTTKHYNGWVGDNPGGYTTEKIHSDIDGGVVERHGITADTLRPLLKFDRKIGDDPWSDVRAYFRRSFEQVEPLYRLERDDQLNGPAGKRLIEARLVDAAEMLNALIRSAWASSTPTAEQVEKWQHYNALRPGELDAANSARPHSKPDPTSPRSSSPPARRH